MFVSHIHDGIKPVGIDIFESDVTLRLINKSSLKTIFSEYSRLLLLLLLNLRGDSVKSDIGSPVLVFNDFHGW